MRASASPSSRGVVAGEPPDWAPTPADALLQPGPPGAAVAALSARVRDRVFWGVHAAVFGGGAMHAIMYIGSLMALCGYSRPGFARWAAGVKDVAGASAGALVASMLAVGMDPWDMRACIRRCGLHKLLASLGTRTWQEVVDTGALAAASVVDATIQEFVADITGDAHTTLGAVAARAGTTLTIVVTNDTLGRPEYWSAANHGSTPLWLALRCTTCVPGLFPAPVVGGCRMFDGGVTCNLPCQLFHPRRTLSMFVHSTGVGVGVGTGAGAGAGAGAGVAVAVAGGATPSSGAEGRVGAPAVAAFARLLSMYMQCAETAVMRARPSLAMNSIPCVPSPAATAAMGIGGRFAFNTSAEAVDALLADGAQAVNAVLFRDVLIMVAVLHCHAAREVQVSSRPQGRLPQDARRPPRQSSPPPSPSPA
jgi:predicted acylesterase/phospholipase RssA